MTAPTPLWEANHPYYCAEGNYYVGGDRYHEVHEDYDSWAEFCEAWGDSDEDMNLVFRWDWEVPDPSDYEPGEDIPPQQLKAFWVLQRKGILRSTTCVVTPADEPAVRAWLTERAKTIQALWAPILPAVTP